MEGSVGVDIGGGGVRAARIEAGRVGPVVRRPLSDREVETVIDTVVGLVRGLSPRRVGVGVPGFVHQQRIIASPNFPSWKGVPLAQRLEDRLGVPVTIENDANAAALGVWRARGATEHLIALTLGTGVGGGVVSEGRLLRGATGTGAELGHIYAGGEAPCGCGGQGCLEQWVGTVGLSRMAQERGHPPLRGRELVEAADHGEAWAQEVLTLAAQALGRGLVTLVNIFNPDAVVITGGLARAHRWLAEPAQRWMHEKGVAPSVKHVEIVWEGRADDFVMLGAAEVASQGRTPEGVGK